MEYVKMNRITFLSLLKNFNIDRDKYSKELMQDSIEITKNGNIYCHDSLYGFINLNFKDIIKYIKYHRNYITEKIQINKHMFILKFYGKKCEIYKNNMNEDNFIQSIKMLYEPFNENFNIEYVKRYIKALYML